MRNYPPQFKADAVVLYRSRPEATIRQAAADLGHQPGNPAELGDLIGRDFITDQANTKYVGAVLHSDHGAQYCSRAFADACREAGVPQSLGAIGSSADNALAESFNATCKRATPGPPGLGHRARGPSGPLPLAAPLQHHPTPLPPRPPQPDRL
jgi:transposase InsO family protein